MERLTILCFDDPALAPDRFDAIAIATTVTRDPQLAEFPTLWCQRFLSSPLRFAVQFAWEWDYDRHAQGQEGSMFQMEARLEGIASWNRGEPAVRVAFNRIATDVLRDALFANDDVAQRFVACARTLHVRALDEARAFLLECFRAATTTDQRLAVGRALITLHHHAALADVSRYDDPALLPIVDELRRIREANDWS